MYDELSAALPEAVYDALDANSHLGAAALAKLQEAFRNSTSGAIFDPAVGAPFGDQFRLALAEGAYFDPVKRGLVLAIARRSSGPETSSSLGAIGVHRRQTQPGLSNNKSQRPSPARFNYT